MSKTLATFMVWFLLLALLAETGATPSVNATADTCSPSNQRTISLGLQDKDGRFVGNVRPDDLTLSEDKALREIIRLERRTSASLSVAILIDTSASQERTLGGTKLAAQRFVESILRSDRDRAALVSFTAEATIEQDLTNDLGKLREAIERVKFVPPRGYLLGGVVIGPTPPSAAQLSGNTAIWDAVWATVDGIQPAAGSRRVIVLLTDGEDTASKTKLRDAIAHAATNDVAIFSIGIAESNSYGLSRDSLKKLSEETGGRAFFPKKVAELDGIFSETTQALQSQYVLSYCSTNQKPAPKPLKIKIELKNPELRQSKLRLSYPQYAL